MEGLAVIKRKVVIFALCFAFIFTACTHQNIDQNGKETNAGQNSQGYKPNGLEKTLWISGENEVVTAILDEMNPEKNLMDMDDLTLMGIGGVKQGEDTFRNLALVRLPLPANVLASQIKSAFLYVKKHSGDAVTFQAGAVAENWITNRINMLEFEKQNYQLESALSEADEDDWYKIDVSLIVQDWLLGNKNNYGFVLETSDLNGIAQFYSAYGEDFDNYPKLRVDYEERIQEEFYGKYEFVEQSDGNCLSFALRDTSGIYYEDLFENTEEFQNVYETSGLPGILTYFRDICLAYIEENKETLGISSIRQLNGEDEKISADEEYKIALKIGVRDSTAPSGIQVDGDFDYHLRVQLKDGSWAEKTPGEKSRVVPGSNQEINIGQYPWDSSYLWGYEKWSEYYTSDTIYFAVKKSTDDFTKHK
ncbi:hypothetical protein FACS189418_6700 [Clostridia bacterium]|nr:hypothetical protein FACS189418_6700 [Clostridia bacterium]